jgi:hypothetical protein
VQRLERQTRHLDYRKSRCPGLSHPSRQQRARAVRLLDNKVDDEATDLVCRVDVRRAAPIARLTGCADRG